MTIKEERLPGIMQNKRKTLSKTLHTIFNGHSHVISTIDMKMFSRIYKHFYDFIVLIPVDVFLDIIKANWTYEIKLLTEHRNVLRHVLLRLWSINVKPHNKIRNIHAEIREIYKKIKEKSPLRPAQFIQKRGNYIQLDEGDITLHKHASHQSDHGLHPSPSHKTDDGSNISTVDHNPPRSVYVSFSNRDMKVIQRPLPFEYRNSAFEKFDELYKNVVEQGDDSHSNSRGRSLDRTGKKTRYADSDRRRSLTRAGHRKSVDTRGRDWTRNADKHREDITTADASPPQEFRLESREESHALTVASSPHASHVHTTYDIGSELNGGLYISLNRL
jgi:hypothetical protein